MSTTPLTSSIVPTSPPAAAASASTVVEDLKDLAFRHVHHVEMMFYPPSWAAATPLICSWICNDFPPSSKSVIPAQSGVYVFVVMTDLFGFPHANGLFYIGKAKNLNTRIDEYINEQNKRFVRRKRPHIWRMINQWHGHLKYFYTTTATVKEAEDLEEQMLSAFQPFFNRKFDATTSATIRAF
jgi:predicted GIY-YIG superfamily endonuclease